MRRLWHREVQGAVADGKVVPWGNDVEVLRFPQRHRLVPVTLYRAPAESHFTWEFRRASKPADLGPPGNDRCLVSTASSSRPRGTGDPLTRDGLPADLDWHGRARTRDDIGSRENGARVRPWRIGARAEEAAAVSPVAVAQRTYPYGTIDEGHCPERIVVGNEPAVSGGLGNQPSSRQRSRRHLALAHPPGKHDAAPTTFQLRCARHTGSLPTMTSQAQPLCIGAASRASRSCSMVSSGDVTPTS